MVTGDTGAEVLREVLAGDCTILHKPVQPEALQRGVATLLATRVAAAADTADQADGG